MTPKGVNQFILNQLCMKKHQLMYILKNGHIKEYALLLARFSMQKLILKGVLIILPSNS